jgi:hypothetical protein
MQVIAFSSQAACASRFSERRVVSVAVRRSTAERFARSPSNHDASNATPGLRAGCEAPARAFACHATAASGTADTVATADDGCDGEGTLAMSVKQQLCAAARSAVTVDDR